MTWVWRAPCPQLPQVEPEGPSPLQAAPSSTCNPLLLAQAALESQAGSR